MEEEKQANAEDDAETTKMQLPLRSLIWLSALSLSVMLNIGMPMFSVHIAVD